MVGLTLQSSLDLHTSRLDRATKLYRQITATKNPLQKAIQSLKQSQIDLALTKIGNTSFQKRTQEQIVNLKQGISPKELSLLVKEETQKAYELRAMPGYEEGRTEFMNRSVLANFIKFLYSKGHTKIGIISGDMDGLKAFNEISPKLGDCALLTVFYVADKVISENGGVIFIPNQLGGDDVVGVFVEKDLEQLKHIGAKLNPTIEQEVPNIRAFTSKTVFGQPLKFSISNESKRMHPKTIRAIEEQHGNREIKGPRITHQAAVIDLTSPETVVDDFFKGFNDTHATIDAIKKADKGRERGSIEPFLGNPV